MCKPNRAAHMNPLPNHGSRITNHALPTPAQESWKFTNLARAVEALRCTPVCTTPGCLEAALPVVAGPQAVFHNGIFMEAYSGSMSLAPGITLTVGEAHPKAESLMPKADSLDSLKAPQESTLTVRGKTLLPLHLIHVLSGPPSRNNVHIVLEEGASLTLIEHHVAAPRFISWQHLAVTITLGKGASLTHSVLQTLPPQCLLTRRAHLYQHPTSTYTATQFQLGANLSRLETHAHLTTSTTFSFTGLALSRHSQHHGTLLHIHHADENNTTHIRQRNLADDAAHAVFQGKFYVAQPAQQTNAYMHCHNLLLSDTARTSHKPELEIYADDVKCSHGAATGGLNAEQLFYLSARGFSPQAARALLTTGYAEEFLIEFPEPVRATLSSRLHTWLHEVPHAPVEPNDFTPIEGKWLAERADTEISRLTHGEEVEDE